MSIQSGVLIQGSVVMDGLSSFNRNRGFTLNLRESRVKKSIQIIQSISSRGKLLDIGCSTGEWALFWKNEGWESYGIDVNEENISQTEKKGIKASLCDLNSQPIPFSDDYFDVIIAGEVIEHLVDTDRFVHDLSRCLKVGGYLLITTPNLVSFENRLRILLGLYPVWVDYRLANSGHVRAYTPRTLKKQLRSFGFEIVKTIGNWVPFIPQRILNDVQCPILAISGSIFPSLSMDIIMLARKKTR